MISTIIRSGNWNILRLISAVMLPVATASALPLEPATGIGTGLFTVETVQGRTVWFADPSNSQLYFDVPDSFGLTAGEPVYVRIEYLDNGRGNIFTEYDSTYGDTPGDRHFDAEIHTRSNRVGSNTFVYSYQVFESPLFNGRQAGGTDFRFKIRGGDGSPFYVASVEISKTPFDDEGLLYVLSKPWLTGPQGEVKDFVDTQTLKGKVLSGYQGWFRVPNDYSDNGWQHWGRSRYVDPSSTEITIDMWPWVNEYDPAELYYAGDMSLRDGRPAFLFSSADPNTVQRHFHWMRKYNIDGVYLQRFVTRNNSGYYGGDEFVLHNVREAARKEGRVWAIEYDVSSIRPDNEPNPFEVITNDWQWLVDEVGILDDPRYLHENGKPVLFIWGFDVPDRGFTIELANQVLDWFAQKDLYLICGGRYNSDWLDHYTRYDQMLDWMERTDSRLDEQRVALNNIGAKILPHAWPGFSWHNLYMLVPDTSYTPRNGGAFYWERLYDAIRLNEDRNNGIGADHIFLGMYDEYDEATAIMPMSDNPPLSYLEEGGTWGRYIDNEGRDPFWYLRLSGYASEVLNGHYALSATMPLESELQPVAYAGDDATVYLGATNVSDGLIHLQPGDGQTTGEFLANHECRTSQGQYFYFDIAQNFLPTRVGSQEVTIEIEYLDNAAGTLLQLEYDSSGNVYQLHPYAVTTPGTGGWKNIRWTLDDGMFSGRQNGASDFRVLISDSAQVSVRRASVFLPEEHSMDVVADMPDMQLSDWVFSWPVRHDAVGWRMFTTTDPDNANWVEAVDSLNFNGEKVELDATPSAQSKFYRLQRPARK